MKKKSGPSTLKHLITEVTDTTWVHVQSRSSCSSAQIPQGVGWARHFAHFQGLRVDAKMCPHLRVLVDVIDRRCVILSTCGCSFLERPVGVTFPLSPDCIRTLRGSTSLMLLRIQIRDP